MKKTNSKITVENDNVKIEADDILLTEMENEEVKVDKEKLIEQTAEEIKEKYRLREVFITNVADMYIVWRKLKRSEYKEIMTQTYSENEDLAFYEKQDDIARKVILYPENVEELIEEFAGVSDIIASETMVKTGFGLTETKAV